MTMNNKRILLIFLLLVTLSSCSGISGNSATVKIYENQSNFIINKTSKSSIGHTYQYPDFIWKDKNGNTVYNYQYAKASPTFISYIPLFSTFINRTRINRYDISLTFDQQDKLKDSSFFYETYTY